MSISPYQSKNRLKGHEESLKFPGLTFSCIFIFFGTKALILGCREASYQEDKIH